MKRVKPAKCVDCGAVPKYERLLDNHNRPWFFYYCPTQASEWDAAAKPTLREAAKEWNRTNKAAIVKTYLAV